MYIFAGISLLFKIFKITFMTRVDFFYPTKVSSITTETNLWRSWKCFPRDFHSR